MGGLTVTGAKRKLDIHDPTPPPDRVSRRCDPLPMVRKAPWNLPPVGENERILAVLA